jgi:molecular chaperone DnaK (HSP70)
LGGDDFDTVLAEAAANQFWRKHKVDIRNQAAEWRLLLSSCEQAKRLLSSQEMAAIVVPDVMRTAQGSIDLRLTIDRAIFERACKSVIHRSLETCGEALELISLKARDLSAVYLSGGTTYIPAVRRGVARAFGVPVKTGVPPDFAVCLGTAIHAAQIQLRAQTSLDAR